MSEKEKKLNFINLRFKNLLLLTKSTNMKFNHLY